jgi:hypothetical protein
MIINEIDMVKVSKSGYLQVPSAIKRSIIGFFSILHSLDMISGGGG